MRFYRVRLDAPRVVRWQVGEVNLFDRNQRIELGGPYHFTSAWKSAGAGEEWVYVDLGVECSLDRIKLFWIQRPAGGSVQVSADAKNWTIIQTLPAAGGAIDDLKLPQPVHGRYVRVLMTKAASPDGYVISELEVFGTGGPVPHSQPVLSKRLDHRFDLGRGAWRLQRDSQVTGDGEAISKAGFDTTDWLPATVPGTVLSSYLDDGCLPDPNYGENQLMISDSFFWADFWYRDELVLPRAAPGRHVWLNFDGINWKADVFFNGRKLGSIEGAFMRGKFDVTKLLRPGGRNVIAVLVRKNANPGSVKEKTFAVSDWNGGALGADNPTYHASIGWDWIPTIRGRNIGIPNDVYITASGPVIIENPFVTTTLPVPNTDRADIRVEATLRNIDQHAVTGTLHGSFGDVHFETRVTIPARSDANVNLDPSTVPELRLMNPKLWWPAGYGDPNLYDVKLSFETAAGEISDSTTFRSGVRQFTYSDEGGALRIFINGRRFIPRGGNWGFSESMLRYRAREYDAALRYHKEMNFNMIRNWVGQTPDNAFYDACDKYGIVVWQDFWLANPYDGPDPNDDDLFLRNAKDTIERIRNHPSVGLFCGRNEGNPPPPLESDIEKLLSDLDPALRYFPSSASGVVSGGGPYRAMPDKFYFEHRATEKLHSELGMPNIVSLDSLKQMMPEAGQWPIGDDWGMHDFTSSGAQSGSSYEALIERSYGHAGNAADWDQLAQFENYDGYRAMFEAQSKNRMGLLLWMSHPAWPSFVWQTYDYYFDPTAAYFGSKKASEPLHIQWNPVTDNVEVVNYSAGNRSSLSAKVEILNMDGSVQWQKSSMLDSAEDSVAAPIKIEFPPKLTPVHFIQLKLMQGSTLISENFYWRGVEEGNYQDLRKLPLVEIEAATHVEQQGSEWMMTTVLNNSSNQPALMVRVKAIRTTSQDRILPAIYSDNYVALMPGESRTIETEVEDADTRGETPGIAVEGFNVGVVSQR
ncbi:MAG: glycosyl hydrolase 2 galactose-binding domain-containing protein [Terriglobales bacterium]